MGPDLSDSGGRLGFPLLCQLLNRYVGYREIFPRLRRRAGTYLPMIGVGGGKKHGPSVYACSLEPRQGPKIHGDSPPDAAPSPRGAPEPRPHMPPRARSRAGATRSACPALQHHARSGDS